MAGQLVHPARSPIGPPAPPGTAWVARFTMLILIILVGHWVQAHLGGVGFEPTTTASGANDTKPIFNWHPILMTLAFGVFMAEAVLTYSAPVVDNLPRPVRKKIHASLHTAAALCAVLGVTAAFKSHSLKRPVPIPDLYSPHSVLGLLVLVLFAMQFLVGLTSYLYPQAPLPVRLALGPIHKFFGKLTWVAGLAAIATGLQEKTTFIQQGAQLSGQQLFSPVIRIPALTQLVLVALAGLVLYHQVPPAKPTEDDAAARQRLLAHSTSEDGSYTQSA